MTKNWTENQKNAINAVNGSVLVSAAAGSGKTAVLVQRIINRVISKENPVDIDKFLIVTFTNAAANEMRNRVSEKLSELLAKETFNLNLMRQQILLKNANIGTIDSFCSKLVKENFYKLGISSKFRIADENEISMLKESAMEAVLEKYYDEKSPEFLALVDVFSSEKNDNKLISSIDKIYEFSSIFPYPKKWFEKILNYFNINEVNPEKSPWGKVLMDFAKNSLEEIWSVLEESLKICELDKVIKKSYFKAISDDLKNINQILSLFKNNNYSEILESIQKFSCTKLGNIRGENPLKTEVLLKRAYIKDILKNLKKYFCFSKEHFLEDLNETFKILKILINVVNDFSDEFENQKLLKNAVTFGDLEHMALTLLVDPGTGKRTELAKELSERFVEIMVDEYQDVNELQEAIFRAISRNEENIFMVGDVKQSIYRFRRANPKIFIEKKDRFNLYNSDLENYPAKIFLDKNFRSRAEILEFINIIFEQLMTKKTGEIEYNSEEYLLPGSDFSTNDNARIELKLLETNENSDEFEAEEIAKMIKNMIENGFKIKDGETERTVTFKDFCVLLRSYSSHVESYESKLRELGVPASCENTVNFFDTREISCILSVLRVVDNPVQDISLIAALMSPAFGFITDEISNIRLQEKNVPFYFALKKAAENGNEKCYDFIQKIKEYRDIAATSSCEKLINYIYEDLSLPAIIQSLPNNDVRRQNLFSFLEYAVKYEGKIFKNLSGFIRFMNKLQKKKSEVAARLPVSHDANVVKIMSIHKSKGLEFPVCFVAGCSRKFNSERDNLLLHEDLGIGIKLKSMGGILSYNTAVRQAISLKTAEEEIAEELRVFYVALTRAKEKLVLIMSQKDAKKTLSKAKIVVGESRKISPFYVLNSKSFADWITVCALKFGFDIEVKKDFYLDEKSEKSEPASENLLVSTHEKIANCQLIKKRLDFKYSFENLKNIPLKTAASIIVGADEWVNHITGKIPDFASEKGMTAAERGTAMHKFLYFADFKNSFEFEISRLNKNKFLSERELETIDKNILKKFFKSEICEKIRKSKRVLREHRFTVNLPANKFYENKTNEKIVVQGAIDLVFENNEEYIIVDYKTDKTSSVRSLFEKYKKQLEIYKLAFEESESVKVKQTMLYSLRLGEGYSG